MNHKFIRFIGGVGLGGAIIMAVGMVMQNTGVELAGIIITAASSFWLAFLVKPEADRIADEEKNKHKVP